MKAVGVLVGLAAVAFFALFSPWTKQLVPFWPVMTGTTALLAGSALILERGRLAAVYQFRPVHGVWGVLAAAVLYGVFWLGHLIAGAILPFAATQVETIYTIRAGQSPWVIALLLILVIGPAEEIFWRGFVQRRLAGKYGVLIGFIAATAIYTLVHVWSGNLMLIGAAAVCGGFWGLLYMAGGNLWPCILSHAIWDVTILILFPVV